MLDQKEFYRRFKEIEDYWSEHVGTFVRATLGEERATPLTQSFLLRLNEIVDKYVVEDYKGVHEDFDLFKMYCMSQQQDFSANNNKISEHFVVLLEKFNDLDKLTCTYN